MSKKNEVKDPSCFPFYEQSMPKIGSLVKVDFKKVEYNSAKVELLEYARREGAIPFTELTARRVKGIGAQVKSFKKEIVEVLRVDEEKGYIDLSKKKLSAMSKEVKNAEENFVRARRVQRTMIRAAAENNLDPMTLIRGISWPLYRNFGKAYDGLSAINTDPSLLDKYLEALPEEVKNKEELKNSLLNAIQTLFERRKFVLKMELKVQCFGKRGVDLIREVLLKGKAMGDEEPVMPVEIQIKGAPKYEIAITTDDRELGEKKLENIFLMMKNDMEAGEGTIEILKMPDENDD